MYNGVVEGLKTHKNIPVLAIETKQAPTFHVAVKAGKVVHLEEVKTIATSLASPYISANSLTNYTAHKTYLAEIDDLDSVRGTIDLYDNFGYLVEPACGASVAPVFHRHDILNKYFGDDLKPDDIIIIVVCGGSGINKEIIDSYRALLV